MFREMRRKRQQLTEAECAEILENGITGILGVIGDNGYPYTVPVNYVYYEGRIYFHGAKVGHKLDAIRSCDKVSFCVIDRDEVIPEKLTTHFRSVILFGRAHILQTDEEIFHAAELLGLKYYPDRQAVDNEIHREWSALCCVEIVPEHITGKEAIELRK